MSLSPNRVWLFRGRQKDRNLWFKWSLFWWCHFLLWSLWYNHLLSAVQVPSSFKFMSMANPQVYFSITAQQPYRAFTVQATQCGCALLHCCLCYVVCSEGKKNTRLKKNLLTFAHLSQITATSSRETTTSSWRTAAWRSSSWVKSQRTGSVAERPCLTTDSFLKWQLASKGHCLGIAQHCWLSRCAASCRFLPVHLYGRCAFQPVQPFFRFLERHFTQRLNWSLLDVFYSSVAERFCSRLFCSPCFFAFLVLLFV